jgi:hypothetical protein
MKKRRRSLGRPLLHARALCDHGAPRSLGDRRKSPVWSTEAIYLLATGQYSRCAGRAIRGPDLRWSASLNRHKIWPDCENGHVKEACAGLKTLCQRMRCYSACRGMYLELWRRPVSRENARPQPPVGSPRYGGGAEELAPVPVGVTGHRTQRPRGQVGPPGPHPAHPSSSLDPGGERRPISPPLAPLIAQLVLVVRSAERGSVGAPFTFFNTRNCSW